MNVSANGQRALIYVTMGLATVWAMAWYFMLDFWPLPSPTLNTEQVVALYAHSNLKFRAGVVIMLITGAYFIPWGVVLAAQMTRDEKGFPIWAILQALGNALGSWLMVFPPFFWGVAAFTIDRDPALTVLMNEIGWLCMVTPAAFFPFQTFPIAVVCLSKKKDEKNSAFPRWIGWLTIWAGIGGLIGASAMWFKTGPFAWNGMFSFYLPVCIIGAWFGIVAFSMLRAIGRQEKAALLEQAA